MDPCCDSGGRVKVKRRRYKVETPSRLRHVRWARSETLEQVAHQVGIPPWRLSQIERNITPRKEEAEALASFFGVDIAELFSQTVEED